MPPIEKTATVHWEGQGRQGKGAISTPSYAEVVKPVNQRAVGRWQRYRPWFEGEALDTLAPWIERLEHAQRLQGALSALTAAVVGVILNLAVWFALHVFFAQVTKSTLGPVTLWQPQVNSLEWPLVVLATVSGYLLLWRHWSIPAVLGVAATASLLWRLAA